MYEDPTEKIVEFTPLHTWQIGEENVVEYTLPFGFDEASSDWIGVYKVRVNNSFENINFIFANHKFLNSLRRKILPDWMIILRMSIHLGVEHQAVIIQLTKLFITWNFPIQLI